jgi:hypothetical protein
LGLVPFVNWVGLVHFSTLDYFGVEYKMHAQKNVIWTKCFQINDPPTFKGLVFVILIQFDQSK